MIDRILGGLYIGTINDLDPGSLREHKITHVLSIVDAVLPELITCEFTTKSIPINDEDNVNVIGRFDETNEFINCALFPGEQEVARGVRRGHATSVLICCQAGVSRSVTVLAAYLMKKYELSATDAIHAISRKRVGACPNEGFREQLELYEAMQCCTVNDEVPLYRQWKLTNSVKLDPTGQSIMASDVTFVNENENENENDHEGRKQDEGVTLLRCKRCRQKLASSRTFVLHVPPGQDSKQSKFIKTAPHSRRIVSMEFGSDTCSHFFVEPLNWMKQELQGKMELEGKLECPKCDTKVGGYNWKGSRCSCGKWMVPAIHLQRSKVDECGCK